MDPNMCLGRIRQLIHRYNEEGALDSLEMYALINHVDDMDSWLSIGGFFPKDWEDK